MMEERYNATTQNRFHPDMSNVNKNITVEAKLISPPTYMMHGHTYIKKHCMTFAQRRNRLKTHFSERNPVVKRRVSVFNFPNSYLGKQLVSQVGGYSVILSDS